MALPRKKNLNIKRRELDAGPSEYKEQFLDKNKSFLPRGVDHADLDSGFVDFVGNDLELSIDGDKVPVLFLTLQRWREFMKTWQNSDKYKNINYRSYPWLENLMHNLELTQLILRYL